VGNRVSGSANLRRAVDYMLEALGGEEGLENVHGEQVMVQHWERGREEGVMLAPRHGYRLNLLGLGSSVGTAAPAGGEGGGFAPLVADVVVVGDWAELEAKGRAGEVEGMVRDLGLGLMVCTG
jgi:carboxypeptidase Q